MSKMIIRCALGLAPLFLVGACATAAPPQELVDARAAYVRAQEGPASQYGLVQLHDARVALDNAERAFRQSPDGATTRDLAYIAERRAQLADVEARIALDSHQGHATAAQRDSLLAQMHGQDRAALTVAAGQLSDSQARLAQAGQDLQHEQAARESAESTTRAALASLQRIANVREEERGMVITLNGSVLFATGESTLLPIATQRLDEVAHALADLRDRDIVVEGHTDNRGSPERNEQLSLQRAQSVSNYLAAHGMRADGMRAIGYGQTRPIVDNGTAEGRANNRRVEIVVAPVSPPRPIASN